MNYKNRGTRMKLEDFMNYFMIASALNHCRDCGRERTKVQFEQLPKNAMQAFQQLFKTEPFKDKKNQFLYCKKCNAYSILSEYFH